MSTALHIGTTIAAVEKSRAAIMAIMMADPAVADSAVKVQALQTLGTLCHVTGTTVTGCVFGNRPYEGKFAPKAKKKR